MKYNPGKCGIKFYCLCDAKNGFALAGNMYCCTSQDSQRKLGFQNKAELSLSSFYNDTGCSVFYWPIFYQAILMHQITTKRSNNDWNRDVKHEGRIYVSHWKTLQVWYSQNEIIMISYERTFRKRVTMSYSLHPRTDPKKPFLSHEYYKGNGGVEIFDSPIDDYSNKWKRNRYPLLFFNILDNSICVFNAFLITKESNSM